CPGDFGDNKAWHHWFEGAPSAKSLTVDVLPSLAGFDERDLCDTGLKRSDGGKVLVYSSQNPKVVERHLQWMRQYGVDGLAFQRFVAHTVTAGLRQRSDNVLGHIVRSARSSGRV